MYFTNMHGTPLLELQWIWGIQFCIALNLGGEIGCRLAIFVPSFFQHIAISFLFQQILRHVSSQAPF